MSESLLLLARLGLGLAAAAHGLASLGSLAPRLGNWTEAARAERALRRCAAVAAYVRNLGAAAAAAAAHPDGFPPPASAASWNAAKIEALTRLHAAQAPEVPSAADGGCAVSGLALRTELHEQQNAGVPRPWPNFVFRFAPPAAPGEDGAVALLCIGVVAIMVCGALWAATSSALRRVALDLVMLDGAGEVCATTAPEEAGCRPQPLDHRRGGSAAFCVLQRHRADAVADGEEALCD